MQWYEQDSKTAVIRFYANIGWWETEAKNFVPFFEGLAAKYENIRFRAHCYGGAVFEGNAIYNSILNCKSHKTWIIEGVSASMSSILMLACDDIQIADNAMVMVHSPSGWAVGTSKDMYSAGKLLGLMEKNFTKRYTEKTGKPAGTVKAWFDGVDHWMDADEAVSIGLADKVIPAVVKNVKKPDLDKEPADEQGYYNRYAALLTEQPVAQNDSTKTEIQMKKTLIEKYGLKGVTDASSDTAVMEALETHFSAQQKGTDAKAQAEAVIASVEKVTGKPFEAAQRTGLLNIGEKAGLEALAMTMAAIAPAATAPASEAAPAASTTAAPNVVNMINKNVNNGQVAEDRKGWTWEDWQKKDAKGLASMEKSNPEQFEALYNAEFGIK
jgi:ATP-dependent Clp protease, protease subunit